VPPTQRWLGNFEGGIAVPPITGPTLFRPLDRDTGRYFGASAGWRVRPAYDEQALARLLRIGDHAGRDHAAGDHAALCHRRRPARRPGGLPRAACQGAAPASTASGARGDDHHADVEPQRRDAMLATLKRFVAQKNGQSRHEANRSMQSQRTREMVMYRKYRVWDLEHWPLSGPPAGWGAQLDAYQAARPVYAVVAGAGAAEWAPVDAFCARQRVPACCRWWTSAPRPRASTACTTTRAWMRTRVRAPACCAPAACGA
jgi:hypothetical protein